jgi:hypothetical protein
MARELSMNSETEPISSMLDDRILHLVATGDIVVDHEAQPRVVEQPLEV